jgi:Tfp pilus assembly protein PilF
LALTLLGADAEVNFVPRPGRVSARELRISDQARDKYTDGESRLKRKDVAGARRRFEEAVALAPEYAAAWNALGVLARDQAEAEEHFRRACSADPDNVDAALNLGALLLKSGRAEEALTYHRQVALSLPGDAAAQSQYAMNLYQLGKLADAERAFLSVKRMEAGRASVPELFLAEIYARRGEKARAVAELEELLSRGTDERLGPTVRAAIERLR